MKSVAILLALFCLCTFAANEINPFEVQVKEKALSCCNDGCNSEELEQLNSLSQIYSSFGGNEQHVIKMVEYVKDGGRCLKSEGTRKLRMATRSDLAWATCVHGPHIVTAAPKNVTCSYGATLSGGITYTSIYAVFYGADGTFSVPSCYNYPNGVTSFSGDCTFVLPTHAPTGNYTVQVYAGGSTQGLYGQDWFTVANTTNDNNPPMLAFFSAPTKVLSSASNFQLSMRATDDLSGVVYFYVYAYGYTAGTYAGYDQWTATTGLLNTGIKTQNFTLNANLPSDVYVYSITVGDSIGWYRYYYSYQLQAANFPTNFTLVDNNCPAGQWKPKNSTLACSNCPIGTYSPGGYSYCPVCPPGTTGTTAGASSCSSCSAGYHGSGGSSACVPCNPGLYTYNSGQAPCYQCYPGSFNNMTGSSACTNCPGGYTSCAGATSCTMCPAGTSAYSGQQYCMKCSAGTYALAGAEYCIDCPQGTYSLNGASTCIACPTGTTTYVVSRANSPLACV